jgi:hypothetical protein
MGMFVHLKAVEETLRNGVPLSQTFIFVMDWPVAENRRAAKPLARLSPPRKRAAPDVDIGELEVTARLLAPQTPAQPHDDEIRYDTLPEPERVSSAVIAERCGKDVESIPCDSSWFETIYGNELRSHAKDIPRIIWVRFLS